MESNPDKFIKISYIHYLNRVRERVTKLIGADTDECVIVNNTSHGLATIVGNLIFNEGDIVVGGVITKSAAFFLDLIFLLTQRRRHMAP